MRPFHTIEPDRTFVFHTRRDMAPRKGEIGNEVVLKGSRAATVVVMVQSQRMVYGVARCQWAFPFNRKLGREVATGRAKQALSRPLQGSGKLIAWTEYGIGDPIAAGSTDTAVYQLARNLAVHVVEMISRRAVANGLCDTDDKFVLDNA